MSMVFMMRETPKNCFNIRKNTWENNVRGTKILNELMKALKQ